MGSEEVSTDSPAAQKVERVKKYPFKKYHRLSDVKYHAFGTGEYTPLLVARSYLK